MIDFSSQTYANIRASMLSQIPNTYDLRDTAPIPTALSPAAYALAGFYLTLNQVQQQAFIQTAVGDALDLLAPLGGISRYPASAAIRLGTFNVSIPIGSRFSTVNGTNSINFTASATATVEDPQEGSFYYQMTAETPGSIGNEYTGPIIPISTIPGLTSAQMTSILVPGDDEETDSELRQRLIEALNNRPFGGNIASYRANILAIDGVGAVQVYPTWNGGGTVACSILGADFMPASSELVENVQNAIDPPTSGTGLGLAPIGAQVTITTPAEVTVNVSATVTLASGYSLVQVQPLVETSIQNYMLSVRQSWGTPTGTTSAEYAADVYVSRVLASIVGTTGIVNASNVQLNGGTSDLILTETGATQQIPVMGTVTLSE